MALQENKVIGTIALLYIENNCGALRKMFVKQSYRGNTFGVGQKLLDTVFKWSTEKHIKKIYLGKTEKFVAAQRFYEKNNFTEIENKIIAINISNYEGRC